MFILLGLMLFSIFIVLIGTVIGIVGLFVLNWGSSADYDSIGNKIRKKDIRARNLRAKASRKK
ncbi:MAG: hypothetical protein EOM05_08210 [Clostridia bacterium]|nr:hypothetical protein [Clostridia bacterium]